MSSISYPHSRGQTTIREINWFTRDELPTWWMAPPTSLVDSSEERHLGCVGTACVALARLMMMFAQFSEVRKNCGIIR